MPENRSLAAVATEQFGLVVERYLPVTESYSSDVLHFQAQGQGYVLKKPFSIAKAEREAFWLNAHRDNKITPQLIDYLSIEQQGYLLMSALPGQPLQDNGVLTAELATSIGQSLAQLHAVSADDFDGFSRWHDLLAANLDGYMRRFNGEYLSHATKAHSQLMSRFDDIPNELNPVCIHFDFRPGNLLAQGDRISGVFDFESMRGGNYSMDFYKLWYSVWQRQPGLKQPMLEGYGFRGGFDLEALMRLYSLYHGLAGLSWCVQRNQMDSAFAQANMAKVMGEFL